MRTCSIVLTAFITIATTACQGSAETALEDVFCDALAGPSLASVDATEAQAGAPETAVGEGHIEVALTAGEDGNYTGVVAYTADEAGFFAFGFDENVPVTVVDGSGATLAWEVEVPGAACDALAIRRTVELGLDTVYLEFGPTDLASVSFIAEESDDDL